MLMLITLYVSGTKDPNFHSDSGRVGEKPSVSIESQERRKGASISGVTHGQ